MSNNLKSCFFKLKLISQIKNEKLRKRVLYEFADDCMYKALNEIALNTVSKKVPLSATQKQKLRKYKSQIKKLAIPTKNKLKRKALVVQSGGFLQFLIPAVSSIIGGLLNK